MQPSELFFAFDFYSIQTTWPAFQFESYQISVRYFVLQSAYMEKILLCIFQVLDKAISFGSVEELYSSFIFGYHRFIRFAWSGHFDSSDIYFLRLFVWSGRGVGYYTVLVYVCYHIFER